MMWDRPLGQLNSQVVKLVVNEPQLVARWTNNAVAIVAGIQKSAQNAAGRLDASFTTSSLAYSHNRYKGNCVENISVMQKVLNGFRKRFNLGYNAQSLANALNDLSKLSQS
uniref:Uncharacterized protein n=1 Tax=Romanomermis culicivorax TaxID=13658 RepID=A0A915KXL5_ROMCU